jgi:LTXXQ motif family protein
MAAPRVAPRIAPHFAAAPARRMAEPHGGPRFVTSHGASHGAPPRMVEGNRPRGGPITASRAQRFSAERSARELSRHATNGPAETPARTAEQRNQRPGLNGHETTGQSAAGVTAGRKGDKGQFARQESTPEQRQTSRQQRDPIIRNPVFASQQPGRGSSSPSTFRGRFTQSALYDHHDRHHHHLGIVLGFIGPLFWPYAYSDLVDYTFSPYAYDTFWPYAFDDVYAGIYGGYAPEYDAPGDAYAYAGSAGSESAYDRATNRTTGSTAPSTGAERICSGQASGLTDFSIQKISDEVQPNRQQQALLDDLKTATAKAVNILQSACPGELPSTPTGRLAAMRARVDAMLQAVATVRPALDKFYQSLSDEQRERFISVDQGEHSAKQQSASLNHLCQGQIPIKSDLPVEKIEQTLHLNPDQDHGLRALDEATMESAKMLQAKCQPDQNITPTGRLAAMADRLQAMSKALDTTQAALDKFYGSLNDEQKAQFDRIKVRAS